MGNLSQTGGENEPDKPFWSSKYSNWHSCCYSIDFYIWCKSQIYTSALTIWIYPVLSWSRKWCHLREICLVLAFKPSLQARTIKEALSSNNCIAANEIVLVMEQSFSNVVAMKTLLCISRANWRRGSNSLVAIGNAIFSLSVALRAISVCNYWPCGQEIHSK